MPCTRLRRRLRTLQIPRKNKTTRAANGGRLALRRIRLRGNEGGMDGNEEPPCVRNSFRVGSGPRRPASAALNRNHARVSSALSGLLCLRTGAFGRRGAAEGTRRLQRRSVDRRRPQPRPPLPAVAHFHCGRRAAGAPPRARRLVAEARRDGRRSAACHERRAAHSAGLARAPEPALGGFD